MNRLPASARIPLQVAFWVVPLAAVVWWASKQQAPTLPSSLGALGWLVGAVAIYALATVARAERWQRILDYNGVPVRRADSYALVPVGYMGNNVLPARGGELLRVFLLGSSTQAKKRTILGTILAERVLDAVALGLILVVLAYGLLRQIQLPSGHVLVIGGALLMVLALVLVALALRFRGHVSRAVVALRPLAAPIRELLSAHGARLLLLSICIWAMEAAVYLSVAQAVGLHLGVIGGLSVVAFTNMCALVPAAPGYIGTYDAAVIFAVQAVTIGVSKSFAFSYLLFLRVVLFIPITLVGLVILVVRYGGLSSLRAARAQQAQTAQQATA